MKLKKTYKDYGKVVVGYSEDFQPNETWEQQGLLCKWEHCVENAPLQRLFYDDFKCPVFGHSCPGGKEQVVRCKKVATELWHKLDERFK